MVIQVGLNGSRIANRKLAQKRSAELLRAKAMRPARGTRQCSMWNPDGGGGEEPIDDPDLIGEEQAEAETEQS